MGKYCFQVLIVNLILFYSTFASPDVTFDVSTDAKNMHDAIHVFGTDESVLINVLTNRTLQQIQKIKKHYHDTYKTDLLRDINKDTSGNLRSVLTGLVNDPYDYLAECLHNSLNRYTRIIFDQDIVKNILCTKAGSDLKGIIEAYKKKYNTTLISDIENYESGDTEIFFKQILTEPLRRTSNQDNVEKTSEWEKAIPHVKDFCTIKENGHLMEFMSKALFKEIKNVESSIEKNHNTTIIDLLKKFCDKDERLLSAYTTVVRFALDPVKYYAEELRKSMIGLGTDDDTLQRIIIERHAIDLLNIKQKYKQLYNTSLIKSISAETSGYYKLALHNLVENSEH